MTGASGKILRPQPLPKTIKKPSPQDAGMVWEGFLLRFHKRKILGYSTMRNSREMLSAW